MQKSLAIFSILLLSISCRSVEKEAEKETVCQQELENKKFQRCIEEFVNKTSEVHDTYKKMMESSSTMSPIEWNVRADFKDSLKCIGDLKCKGVNKLIKFQFDTMDFFWDQASEASDCLGEDRKELLDCVRPSNFNFKPSDNFSQSVVPCVKQILEKTECSVELRVNVERGAYAVSDLYDHMERELNDDGDYGGDFDLIFDPSKYGM